MASALVALASVHAQAQTAPPSGTDIYHVHFAKAAPGQVTALDEAVKQPDTTTPMPEHFVVLRHQQGDDWDYCVIQHLGPRATIEAARTAPAAAARDLRAWHTDTFVLGPSWPEFVQAMGIGDKAAAGAIYAVSVWREVPGHRNELGRILREPQPSKVPVSRLVLQHMEGSAWTFLALDRYASWQDFATDQAADTAPGSGGGWADIRQHSSFHRDTLADRIHP
jgi:hypothetical protein